MAYLELENLAFKNGGFKLHCSLSLEKGAIGVLLGPSGSGKTSLLRCVSGLEKPEEGSVYIAGRRIDGLPVEKRNIGFVFQDLALFDHLDASANIDFGMRRKRLDAATRARMIESLASTMRLTPLLKRRPGTMSGGERQRLALARSLATRPDLILLDEPLSALDAPLRKEMRDFIRSTLKYSAMTALHVTHDVEEALELGDILFLMKSGKILASGDPETLFSNPPDSWSVGFLGLGIALPAQGVAIDSGYIVARTAAGPLRCPHPSVPPGSSVFLPSARARLVGGNCARAIDKNSVNSIELVVEKTAFNGRGKRITARVARLPGVRAVFEGEIGAGYLVGEPVVAEYPIESCRLIPEVES